MPFIKPKKQILLLPYLLQFILDFTLWIMYYLLDYFNRCMNLISFASIPGWNFFDWPTFISGISGYFDRLNHWKKNDFSEQNNLSQIKRLRCIDYFTCKRSKPVMLAICNQIMNQVIFYIRVTVSKTTERRDVLSK